MSEQAPTIIDVEASGLERGSYPIEVGFVTSDKEVGCSLIRPVERWTYWNPNAELLHGISREVLEEHGKDIVWVANWLNKHLRGKTVFSDAWGNDMSWIGKLFDEAEVPQLFKIESLLTLLTENEKNNWSNVYNQVVANAKLTRHRASSDALMIQNAYKRIKGVN